jgi:RNA polymerase sigma factor (sigma-70 family)
MITAMSKPVRGSSPLPIVAEKINASRLCSSAPSDLTVLLEEVARGNKLALSDLYSATVTQAYSLASRILRSKECAQEIVCDVFVYVWQNAHTYDSTRGSVRAWLAIITRNRAIDRVRKNAQYRSSSEQLVNVSPAEGCGRPEDLLANFQEGNSVYAALAHVSPSGKAC